MIRNFLLRALFVLLAGGLLALVAGKVIDYFHLPLSFDAIVIGIAMFVVIIDQIFISRILLRQSKQSLTEREK
jgi:hypothetical protein